MWIINRKEHTMNDFSIETLIKHSYDFDMATFEHAESSVTDEPPMSDVIFNEYLYFSKFWQHAFIESDYIVDTGNFQTVNRELLYRFEFKILQHPWLWKLFRFIFAV